MTIEDFKSFFRQDVESVEINLNVMINTVLVFFKDIFIQNKIQVNIEGDVKLNVSFVKSELKHILLKLIFNIMYLLKEKGTENKTINIFLTNNDSYVELEINSNVQNVDDTLLNKILNSDESDFIDSSDTHLGLHLVKILIEKNYARLSVKNQEDSISYYIKFFG